jgi:hypothetical protein
MLDYSISIRAYGFLFYPSKSRVELCSIFSSSFSNIKQNTKLPRGKQHVRMHRRVQTSLLLLNQVCQQIVPLMWRPTNCVALSSTDSWMEKMIRKKQVVPSELAAAVQVDPLDELQRYLRQPRLKRGECPNPIAWWGVSDDFPFVTSVLSHFVASIRVSSPSSYGSGLPGHPCNELYCRTFIFTICTY